MKFLNEKGFSLIEVLTVLAIIAILASIATPHYAGYRDKAKMVTVYTTLRQIRLVQEIYWIKHESYFPDPIVMDGGKVYTLGDAEDSIAIPRGQTYTLTPTTDSDTGAVGYLVIIETNFDRNLDGIIDRYRFTHEVLPDGVTNETPMPLSPIIL